MDTGSLVVVLGLVILVLGLSLMRKGSRGAESEPSEYEEGEGNDNGENRD